MSFNVTQCPACESTFNTNSRVLAAAAGRVRCGACLKVFDAVDHFLVPEQDDADAEAGESVFVGNDPQQYFDPSRFLTRSALREPDPSESPTQESSPDHSQQEDLEQSEAIDDAFFSAVAEEIQDSAPIDHRLEERAEGEATQDEQPAEESELNEKDASPLALLEHNPEEAIDSAFEEEFLSAFSADEHPQDLEEDHEQEQAEDEQDYAPADGVLAAEPLAPEAITSALETEPASEASHDPEEELAAPPSDSDSSPDPESGEGSDEFLKQNAEAAEPAIENSIEPGIEPEIGHEIGSEIEPAVTDSAHSNSVGENASEFEQPDTIVPEQEQQPEQEQDDSEPTEDSIAPASEVPPAEPVGLSLSASFSFGYLTPASSETEITEEAEALEADIEPSDEATAPEEAEPPLESAAEQSDEALLDSFGEELDPVPWTIVDSEHSPEKESELPVADAADGVVENAEEYERESSDEPEGLDQTAAPESDDVVQELEADDAEEASHPASSQEQDDESSFGIGSVATFQINEDASDDESEPERTYITGEYDPLAEPADAQAAGEDGKGGVDGEDGESGEDAEKLDDSTEAIRARALEAELDDEEALEAIPSENLAALGLMSSPLEFLSGKESRILRSCLLALCIVAMGGLLGGQYLWRHMALYSQLPQLRGAYELACSQLGCTLPQFTAIDAIRSENLSVQTHPTLENGLMVNTIIRNTADFEQPFPILILSFNSASNSLIALREFSADEYLDPGLRSVRSMPSMTPVQIDLEIMDPGPLAVNYTLAFRLP